MNLQDLSIRAERLILHLRQRPQCPSTAALNARSRGDPTSRWFKQPSALAFSQKDRLAHEAAKLAG